MFNRLMAQNLAWNSKLEREGNRNTWKKTLGVRLRSTYLSPSAEPRTRSGVVEVGGATDDYYANLANVHERIKTYTWRTHVRKYTTQNYQRTFFTLRFFCKKKKKKKNSNSVRILYQLVAQEEALRMLAPSHPPIPGNQWNWSFTINKAFNGATIPNPR